MSRSGAHRARGGPLLHTLAYAYRQALMTARTSALAAAQKGVPGPRGAKGDAGKAGQPGKPGKAGAKGAKGAKGGGEPKEPVAKKAKGNKGKNKKKQAPEDGEYEEGKRYIGGNPLGPPCRAFAKASGLGTPSLVGPPLWGPS